MTRKEVSEITTRKEVSQNSSHYFKGSRMIQDFSAMIREEVSNRDQLFSAMIKEEVSHRDQVCVFESRKPCYGAVSDSR
jgi:hypothetical protein